MHVSCLPAILLVVHPSKLTSNSTELMELTIRDWKESCFMVCRNAAQEAIIEVPAVEPYEALKKKMMEAAEAAVEARRLHAVHDVSPIW